MKATILTLLALAACTPSGGPPDPAHVSARTAAAVAWDPIRERVVSFGGDGDAGADDETWTFDGTAWTKHEVPGPSPRFLASFAWDARRERLVLFGGDMGAVELRDTWTWDGRRWEELPVVHGEPGIRAQAGAPLIWDPARQALVLFDSGGGAGQHGFWTLTASAAWVPLEVP